MKYEGKKATDYIKNANKINKPAIFGRIEIQHCMLFIGKNFYMANDT